MEHTKSTELLGTGVFTNAAVLHYKKQDDVHEFVAVGSFIWVCRFFFGSCGIVVEWEMGVEVVGWRCEQGKEELLFSF